MSEPLSIVVAGGGPTGMGLAAALARHGAQVRVIDPDPARPWVPRYGLWYDEAKELGLTAHLARCWQDTEVRFSAGTSSPKSAAKAPSHESGVRALGRGYALLDNEKLRGAWLGEIRAAGGELEQGRVVDGAYGWRDAHVVFDATGHRSTLTVRRVEDEPAQTALGWTVRWPDHPWRTSRALLMDWSIMDGPVPTFLYALPLDEERIFVEETALSAKPPVPFEELERRLRARLHGLGAGVPEILDEERCWIPMGAPPQRGGAGIVPFGGAAGLVHPATGYLVARSLRIAEEVAGALAVADVPAEGVSARARDALETLARDTIWSAERRASHALYRFGLEALLRMKPTEVASFFGTFFDLPAHDWGAYLAGTSDPQRVRNIMWRVFVRSGPALKWNLARAGLGTRGATLLGESLAIRHR